MACGDELCRESGGSQTEVPVLSLTECSWQWRLLPFFFTAQLEINRCFLVCVVAPNICSMSMPLNPAVLPDF